MGWQRSFWIPRGGRSRRSPTSRHPASCFNQGVCINKKNNQFAFLYYHSRRLAASVIGLGQSAIVWKKTKKYGFFKARSFFLLIHSRCCVLLASEQFTGDYGFL